MCQIQRTSLSQQIHLLRMIAHINEKNIFYPLKIMAKSLKYITTNRNPNKSSHISEHQKKEKKKKKKKKECAVL